MILHKHSNIAWTWPQGRLQNLKVKKTTIIDRNSAPSPSHGKYSDVRTFNTANTRCHVIFDSIFLANYIYTVIYIDELHNAY